MTKKPSKRPEYREVIYDPRHWASLERFRKKAIGIMEALEDSHLGPITHGSTVRGDVTQNSDIDIFIPNQVSSFTVEVALDKIGIVVGSRSVVQATPTYAMKAHMKIDENTSVSFPLMKMRNVEREFYKFGGEASAEDLRNDLRFPGVDKQLMLVEPTTDGHKEHTIVGREMTVAKVLDISVQTVLDRVHTLLRRDEVGRTGVFIKRELSDDETFEMALKRIADKNPAVRRRLRMS